MKTEKEKASVNLLYRTKWLLDFLVFIALYPFGLEDLAGECWKWIKGYEGLYQISNFSRVKSFFLRKGSTSIKCSQGVMILRPHLTKNGYLMVSLSKNREGKDFLIHRLVAQTFIPNPKNKATVNHKNSDKFNNCVENLEWQTQSENNEHAVKTGLTPSGENCKYSKLTEEQVKYILEHYKPRDPQYSGAALARKFNVSPGTITNIIHGKTYKNITKDTKGDENFE